ncbi:rho GTPase-activating protein 92B [Bradysia coprophila]|uniref:rho GTPase-activating protein 92B n=1 Tax=Bradysia coprophila TaxID=38358 RepID=UPI00187DBCBD|nr:rho GTPase-activating protein 92B [Bradysia coprophila]
MKKQLHKIKIAAENFSRPAKPDKNSEELLTADRQVERYKDVLEKISKKFTQNPGISADANDPAARDKRCKKVHEHRLAQAMEESTKDLPDGLLRNVLESCADLEKRIANEIVSHECNVENDVTKKLANIMETNISSIQKQKRIVTKLMQDNESAKHKYQAALRVNDNASKINQLKEEQEECETKLEKERDIWAAEMFELIAEEENMVSYIINYVKQQEIYYKSALKDIERVMQRMDDMLMESNKRIFKVSLEDHLAVTKRKISQVIELCVCCLLEKGLYEEGLLRVGSAGSKLRRLKSVIDANYITAAMPAEYQDVHVIAGVLKSYLRGLPNPLLTYRLYDDFVQAAQQPTEDKRKKAILNAVNQLPTGHYYNLRYLTKFLSILAQKSQHNKMSSQNIAIVMSPNLLWPLPDAIETDYVQEVNSTAAVNTIVELLVSDWHFFFDGEIEFYVTLTRDELFPDNGGFPFDRDPDNMTKSLLVTGSTTVSYQSHSRSSSHDASLILIDDTIKRSQSSSSLSDNSSPPQSSPKPTVRRKHNKQVAPTPPPTQLVPLQRTALTENIINAKTKLTKTNSDSVHNTHPAATDDSLNGLMRPPESKSHSSSQTTTVIRAKRFGSNDNLSKPDKPPRPAQSPAECQTLNRNTYRTKNERTTKPVALPRTSLSAARSSENLSDGNQNDEDSESVIYREKTDATMSEKPDKPAIPERPISLMRPPSFKGTSSQSHDNVPTSETPIKKTQSFRGSCSDSKALNGGNSLTTLERTHIYNVDKKQVAIIDVGDSSNGKNQATNDTKTNPVQMPATTCATGALTNDDKPVDNIMTVSQTDIPITHHVPPSPRGFDPKIKRPVVPPPVAPPINRPKSDGDSTNL